MYPLPAIAELYPLANWDSSLIGTGNDLVFSVKSIMERGRKGAPLVGQFVNGSSRHQKTVEAFREREVGGTIQGNTMEQRLCPWR